MAELTGAFAGPAGYLSFYPDGEVLVSLCNDGEDIDWLFLSDNALNENLPLTYQAVPQIKFCPNFGAPVFPGGWFCGKCVGEVILASPLYGVLC